MWFNFASSVISNFSRIFFLFPAHRLIAQDDSGVRQEAVRFVKEEKTCTKLPLFAYS
jgi:hypothetical protein